MAQRKDLSIDQGATYEAVFSVLDMVGAEADISGYTPRAQMRRHYSSSNSVTFACEITGDNVTISMPADQTKLLAPGHYVYDVDLVDESTSTVIRLVQGVVRVSPAVTR